VFLKFHESIHEYIHEINYEREKEGEDGENFRRKFSPLLLVISRDSSLKLRMTKQNSCLPAGRQISNLKSPACHNLLKIIIAETNI